LVLEDFCASWNHFFCGESLSGVVLGWESWEELSEDIF